MSRLTIAGICTGIPAGVCVGYLVWSHLVGHDEITQSAGLTEDESSVQGLSTELGDSDPSPAEFQWLARALQRIDELGNTDEAIEQVASGLPDIRAQGLRLIAIKILADRDLPRAIVYALTLDLPTVQTAALQRVAGIAANSDPADALQHVSLIPEGLRRREFTALVLEAWASRDPAAALAYIERADVYSLGISAETFSSLPPKELNRLLSIMSRFPPSIRADFEQAAIDKLIVSDPGSAYAYADGLPAGAERDRLFRTLVSNHTRLNAKEALTQILSVNSPPVLAIDNVLAAIAAEDFPYAFDRAIESLVSGKDQGFNDGRLGGLIAATSGRNPSEIAAAVELVANHPDQRVRRQLIGQAGGSVQFGLLARWAEVDPDGAAGWVIRNPSQVSPAIVEVLGKLSASTSGNSAFAQEALNDLPEELRGYWMAGMAEGLATSTLDAALEWLAPARGTPVYATTVDRVLTSAASAEPEAVARAIDGLPDAPADGTVLIVAREWGGQEPSEAGDWLASNGNIDDELRALALRQVVSSWAERDLSEARTWVMKQPAGALRDSALGAVVQTAAGEGSMDQQLLEGFSADSARAEALVGAMDVFRRSDPSLGRSLIDRYISDPALRDIAAQRLEGRAPPRAVRVVGGVTVE